MLSYPPNWRLSYHAGASLAPHNPIHGGVFIRNALYGTMGTMACIVNAKAGGTPYILSNTHVLRPGYLLAPNTLPQSGDAVLQPPGGTGSRVVGHVAASKIPRNCCYDRGTDIKVIEANLRAGSIADFFDASLGYLTTSYSYDIPGIGIPTGTIEPQDGMPFKALTGYSGMIHGQVVRAKYNNIGNYESGFTSVENNIFTNSVIWHGGDSGSLLVEPNTRRAIGLVYATALSKSTAGKTITLAFGCRATVIEKAYGVSFAGKQGTFNAGGTPLPTENPPPVPGMLPEEIFGIPTTSAIVGGVAGLMILSLVIH